MLIALAAAGCTRGASTPEDAYGQLATAVRAGDAAALFEALDLETRWAWMTIQRAHREAYDVVLSNFPDDERERALPRYEDGAHAEDAAALFARKQGPAALAALRGRLPDRPSFTKLGEDDATTAASDGKPLPFHRRKGWGYRGFYEEAKSLEKRAWADLESVRTSATDFERAAARSGK